MARTFFLSRTKFLLLPQLFSSDFFPLRISQALLAIFLIVFPFQIRTLFYSPAFYFSGNFDFYTSFFLYLGDLLLLLAFLAWGISRARGELQSAFSFGDEKFTALLLLFLLLLAGGILVAEDKLLHLLLTFRLVEFFLFYLLIVNRVLNFRAIIFCFLAGMSFQALTAFFQYLVQGSLGLSFLGEPLANIHTPGVAKLDLPSVKLLRAFGTFPHANLLGGAMAAALVLALFELRKYALVLLPMIFLFATALVFSFSRSAFIALGTGFFVYMALHENKISARKILLAASLLVFLIVIFRLENILLKRFFLMIQLPIAQRALYLGISLQMLLGNLFGLGLGGFTLQMQNFTAQKLLPWLYQPVHDIFLLALNEAGLLAGLVFCSLFIYLFYRLIKLRQNLHISAQKRECALLIALMAVFFTIGLLDHYFWTIFAGQAMLFLLFGMVSSFLADRHADSRSEKLTIAK